MPPGYEIAAKTQFCLRNLNCIEIFLDALASLEPTQVARSVGR